MIAIGAVPGSHSVLAESPGDSKSAPLDLGVETTLSVDLSTYTHEAADVDCGDPADRTIWIKRALTDEENKHLARVVVSGGDGLIVALGRSSNLPCYEKVEGEFSVEVTDAPIAADRNPATGSVLMIEVGIAADAEVQTIQLDIFLMETPTNDSPNFARSVGAIPAQASVNSSFATQDVSEPSCAGGISTVWFTVKPAATTSMYIRTFGSDFDTTLGVYTKGSGGFTEKACNDDAAGTSQSGVNIELTKNTTYYIGVGARESGGNVVLDLSAANLITIAPVAGTVNTSFTATLTAWGENATVDVTWIGNLGTRTSLGPIDADGFGNATAAFKVPATVGGPSSVEFRSGTTVKTLVYTVVPRIKVTPDPAARGQQVDVSLRGFGKRDAIRIRWKKGSTWVQVATVTASNTGSANVKINVPAWAADGEHSVRADGVTFKAQTNVVTVLGGGPVTSVERPTPKATATATATPTPTATPEPVVTEIAEPTVIATPEPAVTEEATAVPTEEATTVPTAEATAVPSVEPTLESTIEPTETPSSEPTATITPAEGETPGA